MESLLNFFTQLAPWKQYLIAGGACIFLFKQICHLFERKPQFTGKTVLITGVSSGIGEWLTYRFSALGARLIVVGRKMSDLDRVANKCANPESVIKLEIDLVDPLNVSNKLKKFIEETNTQVDIVINNAGFVYRSMSHDIPFTEDTRMLNVNLVSAMAVTKAFLPQMKKRGSGQIVMMSSVAGLFPVPNTPMYCATKFASEGFFEALGFEMAEFGVAVTRICPGFIRTSIAEKAVTKQGAYGKSDHDIGNGMPLSQFGPICIRAIYNRSNQTVIAGLEENAGVFLSKWFPGTAKLILAVFGRMKRKEYV